MPGEPPRCPGVRKTGVTRRGSTGAGPRQICQGEGKKERGRRRVRAYRERTVAVRLRGHPETRVSTSTFIGVRARNLGN